jgi:CRISPR-associated protein Cmr5
MTAQSQQRSLEQKRAAQAWACIASVTGSRKEYLSIVRGAPSDIQTNGLGQALAFWKAKGYQGGKPKRDDPHAQLYMHVSNWVRQEVKPSSSADLLQWVANDAETSEYRRATVEALAFLVWLKRFAEAELGEEAPR